MRGGLLLWAIVVVTAGSALAQTDEEQARQIAHELQCPVCQGLSVADSTSELATQMRALIRERLRAGENRDAIVGYFVARYGESILITPPRTGLNTLIWLAPYLGVVLGIAILASWLRGRRSAAPTAPPTQGEADVEGDAALAPYYEEVDRTLERLRDTTIR